MTESAPGPRRAPGVGRRCPRGSRATRLAATSRRSGRALRPPARRGRGSRAHRRRSHLRNQRRGGVVVERFALVVDRGGGHAGFDQVDPPAVHDLVVGRGGDGHGPAEVMSDTQAHAPIMPRPAPPPGPPSVGLRWAFARPEERHPVSGDEPSGRRSGLGRGAGADRARRSSGASGPARADLPRAPPVASPRHLPFRRAASSFMRWQAHRGVLDPLDASPPGSLWWRAVNERLLGRMRSGRPRREQAGAPSSPAVRLWLEFVARPTARHWYRAHNSSIVSGYLEHRQLADAERAGRFFMNVALARVLYTHAVVAARAWRWDGSVRSAAWPATPGSAWRGCSCRCAGCSRTAIPWPSTSRATSATSNAWAGCSTTRSSSHGCRPSTSGPPKSSANRTCSIWCATATRSHAWPYAGYTCGVLGTCRSRAGCSCVATSLNVAHRGARLGRRLQ